MTTGEGTRVKKVLAAILLAIGGMMAGTGALAQVQMDVYFTGECDGTRDSRTADGADTAGVSAGPVELPTGRRRRKQTFAR